MECVRESPTELIRPGFFFRCQGTKVRSARLAFRAGGWGAAAAGIEHGVDELEDGALIGGGELFDALEPLEQPGGEGGGGSRHAEELVCRAPKRAGKIDE